MVAPADVAVVVVVAGVVVVPVAVGVSLPRVFIPSPNRNLALSIVLMADRWVAEEAKRRKGIGVDCQKRVPVRVSSGS